MIKLNKATLERLHYVQLQNFAQVHFNNNKVLNKRGKGKSNSNYMQKVQTKRKLKKVKIVKYMN